MGKIPFKVSARTAKLIGQENFSNADGAVIELVKNCYDADATRCVMLFDIPYPEVPAKLSAASFKKFSAVSSFKKSWYQQSAKEYIIAPKQATSKELQDFFYTQNAIYIIDNGTGMNDNTIRNQWMEIGTGNKETDFRSDSGRVKTGAKGIGRFALDRLGHISEFYTFSHAKGTKTGFYWKMDWQQFNLPGKGLTDIMADLEEYETGLVEYLATELQDPSILNLFKPRSYGHGTMIKISHLKDTWNERSIGQIYKSLEALVPPSEMGVAFALELHYLQFSKKFGKVDTAYFNDYDYKITGRFDATTLKIHSTITRNELDIKKVKSKYATLFKKEKAPNDLATLSKGSFSVVSTVHELLKWKKSPENQETFQHVGDFSFSFYFLKTRNSAKENYPYKVFNGGERSAVMEKFGGIKIYRDDFKVRPYGENGNDWLKLGERASASPAGAGQRIGDWRVGPHQIAGTVHISRIQNKQIVDKSDRGALVENEAFGAFQKILIGVIHYFEIDRSIILNKFYEQATAQREEDFKKEIQRKAEELATKMVEERKKVAKKKHGGYVKQSGKAAEAKEKQAYKKLIASGLEEIAEKETDEAEIAQVRALASLGLIVASFSHELKEIQNNAEVIPMLEDSFKKLEPTEKKLHVAYQDGINILEIIKADTDKITHWINYALTAVKSDKRKRNALDFVKYFTGLKQSWEQALLERNIHLQTINKIKKNYLFRAYEVDMDTIFSNLISNSIDAFKNARKKTERKITITLELIDELISIIYEDSGPGLDDIFKKNKDEIFLPFITSKKDRDGNDIGTGLGMYLVKSIINDYKGEVAILNSSTGFKLKMEMPLRKPK